MAFGFRERPGKRQSVSQPASETIEYVATGFSSTDTLKVYADSLTSSTLLVPSGFLYRQSISIQEVGTQLHYVTVQYGERQIQTGQYQLSFDTTGGTVHIGASKETKGRYAAAGDVPDHKGAIGVQPDGTVEGTEIVIPALKLTATYRHPRAVITLPQIRNLARATGSVNSTSFLGFDAGEVLFLGCSGEEGTQTETSIAYQFACSENLQNEVLNGITIAEKRGWDYLWIAFEDAVDVAAGEASVRRPKYVYVERVYREVDLAALLGFGAV